VNDWGYFRRIGESERAHRKRVTQAKRVVEAYEQVGRGDLAYAVAQAGESPVRGRLYVTLEIVCGAAHGESRRSIVAARVNVYTDGRFHNFDRAWGSHGALPGTWQQEGDCERTSVSAAADGHRRWAVLCGKCGRPVQIREDRLEAELRDMWAPGVIARRRWPDEPQR
jgi:hypothetical protein